MTIEAWRTQGNILGSLAFERTWAMNAASNDPGTVQIHIQRTLDKAAAEKHWQNDPCHNVDLTDINRKENCKPCNFVAKLAPLYQFTVNGGWSAI